MELITVYDATHANVGQLPIGVKAAGYTTGSGAVPWSTTDWESHPDGVRICQDADASDETADVLDVERGAAPISKVVEWQRAAWQNRARNTRAGQRWPAIYASASAITPICNALQAAKITSGVFLWVANWSLTAQEADTDVITGSGPWPIIGVQYRSTPTYDISVVSGAWWGNVTPAPAIPSAPTKQQAAAALITLTAYVGESR